MGLSRADLQTIAGRTGYPVRAAWVTRGHGTMGTVVGVMRHHTGTPLRAGQDNYPTLRVIREGRSDLPGPLANYGLGRDGTIYLITEQVAWHAGGGSWGGITDGNGHFLGVEAESDGQARTWTAAQKDCYPRLVAAVLGYLGRDASWAPRHAQYARPSGRKTDTAGLDEGAFSGAVTAYLRRPSTINRNSGTPNLAVPVTPGGGQELAMDAAARTAFDALSRKVGAIDTAVQYMYQVVVFDRMPDPQHPGKFVADAGQRTSLPDVLRAVQALTAEVRELRAEVAAAKGEV
jgi:hypothetical protein